MSTETFPIFSRLPTELISWDLISNTFVHQSPYTGGVDTVAMAGSMWAFTAVWRNRGRADRALWSGFLARLGGKAGRFYYSHPDYLVPRGTARGSGTVSAAAVLATSIQLNGLAAGASLLEGDFVEIGTALLVQVVANATANGSGVIAALSVRPMLRAAVTGGTAFSVAAPRAQFRLVEDRQGVGRRPGPAFGFGDFQIDAVEAY